MRQSLVRMLKILNLIRDYLLLNVPVFINRKTRAITFFRKGIKMCIDLTVIISFSFPRIARFIVTVPSLSSGINGLNHGLLPFTPTISPTSQVGMGSLRTYEFVSVLISATFGPNKDFNDELEKKSAISVPLLGGASMTNLKI